MEWTKEKKIAKASPIGKGQPRQKTLGYVTRSEIQKTQSEHGIKRSPSIIEQEKADAMLGKRTKTEKDSAIGGNFDRLGNPRVNVGGRPRKILQQPQVGDVKSPQKAEVRAAAKLRIISEAMKLKEQMMPKSDADLRLYWQAVSEIAPSIDRKLIKRWIKDREKFERIVEITRAGASGRKKRGFASHSQEFKPHKSAQGYRAPGAGRLWRFGKHTEMLKRWLRLERTRGHQIDRTDIRDEWSDLLEADIQKLRGKILNAAEKITLRDYEHKFKQINDTKAKANVKQLMVVMMTKMGARPSVPQRSASLTAAEEKIRCHLTWQQIDHRMALIARSQREEIQDWVADPPLFAAQRQNTWLVMADQIPFWIQIGMLEHVYADHERGRGTAKEQRDRRVHRAVRHQQSQRFAEAPEIPDVPEIPDGDRDPALEDEDGEASMQDSDREGHGMIDSGCEGDLLGSLEDGERAMSEADPDQEPESKAVKIEDGDREDSLGVAELGRTGVTILRRE